MIDRIVDLLMSGCVRRCRTYLVGRFHTHLPYGADKWGVYFLL